MSEVLFISGARGGTGVTTCAVNIAYALSLSGERTLYIDGDAACGCGLEMCGLQGLSVYTLADVEEGACRTKQAILQHPSSPNFYILPALGCKSAEIIGKAVEECAPLFDYILCDGVAARACGKAILVCDPYSPSLTRARMRGGELKDGGFKQVGLIVNKVNGGLVFDGAILTPQEIASVVRLPLWGVIPEDLTMPLGKIKSSTKKAFAMTAEFIVGRSQKTYGVVRQYAGLNGMIKRKMRSRI